MTREQHVELAEVLHSVRGMVLLSGYDSPLYRELYADWQISSCAAIAEMSAIRTEFLWVSPNAGRSSAHRPMLLPGTLTYGLCE
jgi:DNA adenine methylase